MVGHAARVQRQVSSAEPVIAQLAPCPMRTRPARRSPKRIPRCSMRRRRWGCWATMVRPRRSQRRAGGRRDERDDPRDAAQGRDAGPVSRGGDEGLRRAQDLPFFGLDRSRATPAATPLTTEQVAAMAFSYWRDRDAGIERPLWNCALTKRADRRQCMKQQVLLSAVPVAAATVPAAVPVAKGPEDLGGVRRKGEAVSGGGRHPQTHRHPGLGPGSTGPPGGRLEPLASPGRWTRNKSG